MARNAKSMQRTALDCFHQRRYSNKLSIFNPKFWVRSIYLIVGFAVSFLILTIFAFDCDPRVWNCEKARVTDYNSHVTINDEIALIIAGKCDYDTLYYLERNLYSSINMTSMIPAQTVISITHLKQCKFTSKQLQYVVDNFWAKMPTSIGKFIDIKLVTDENHQTIAYNRNNGVLNIPNPQIVKYLTFFDLDDISSYDRLKTIYNAFQKNQQYSAILHGLQRYMCKSKHVKKHPNNVFIDDIGDIDNEQKLKEVHNYVNNVSNTLRIVNDDSIVNLNSLIEKKYSKITHWDTVYDALSWNLFGHKYTKYQITNGWPTMKYDVYNQIGGIVDEKFWDVQGEDVATNTRIIVIFNQLVGFIDQPLAIYCKRNV